MYRLSVAYDDPENPESFDAKYFDEHAPLCKLIPGLRSGYFSKPRLLGPGLCPYLVAEFDFDDADALRAALGSPEMAAVARHADLLPARRVMFTGEVIRQT